MRFPLPEEVSNIPRMARKKATEDRSAEHRSAGADAPDQPGNARRSAKPSALLGTRVIYCGDNFELNIAEARQLPEKKK